LLLCVDMKVWRKGSVSREPVQGIHEGDTQEDDARNERRHGDGDPDLLGMPLDLGYAVALCVLAQHSCFRREQAAEIARRVGPGEYREQTVKRGDPCERRPLSERFRFGESLADPAADDRQVARAGAVASGGETVECGA